MKSPLTSGKRSSRGFSVKRKLLNLLLQAIVETRIASLVVGLVFLVLIIWILSRLADLLLTLDHLILNRPI
jgi:hypothetical protein